MPAKGKGGACIKSNLEHNANTYLEYLYSGGDFGGGIMKFNGGAITEESANKATEIVRQVLEECFKNEGLVFHQILAKQRFDHDDEYLHIYIVYEGDRNLLDPRWTNRLVGIISPQLAEIGIPYPASKSFIPKDEWEEMRQSEYDGAVSPANSSLCQPLCPNAAAATYRRLRSRARTG